MAVAPVDVGVAGAASGLAASVPYPAVVASGELALLFCESGSGTTPVAPSGFTLVGAADANSTEVSTDIGGTKGYIYRRECNGTEGGTSVALPGVTGHTIGTIATFSGHDTSVPVTVSSAEGRLSAQTTVQTASLPTKANDGNDIFLAFYAHDRDSAAQSGTSGSTFTNIPGTKTVPISDTTSLSGGGGVYVFQLEPTGNSTGTVAHSANTASTIWASLLLRINASGSMGGGGTSGDVGMATSANTAYALGGTHIATMGAIATNANTALALTAAGEGPVGRATEVNTALALTGGSSGSAPPGIAIDHHLAIGLPVRSVAPITFFRESAPSAITIAVEPAPENPE